MGKNPVAAFIFFTRLPLGRIVEVPASCYKRIVPYWPLTGWLTAAVTAGVLYGASLLFPVPVAVMLALCGRLWLTGALHEDGLSDFLDGFGGGGTPERTLAIMKDSHVGNYGTIGLVVYFLLLASVLSSLPVPVACAAIAAGDPLAKFVSAQTIDCLPYVRTAEQSKARTVYEPMRPGERICAFVCGLLPSLLLLRPVFWLAGLGPFLVWTCLCAWMKKRIGGYTGDCCGAMFLLTELSFYLSLLALCGIYGIDLRAAYFG